MKRAAEKEGVDPQLIAEGLARGTVALPANPNHLNLDPWAIGHGLRTKVNANIGTSADSGDTETELEKLRTAIQAGADAVMDLSTGGDLPGIRRTLLFHSSLPLGTVPLYQTACQAVADGRAIVSITPEELFRTIEEQAMEGVDFMTVHCGVTLSTLERLRGGKRLTDVVSRGGAFLIGWMLHHQQENPLYEHFDWLLEIAHKYDITLSLGDGLRPGSIVDATDRSQIEELITLGELVERAWEAGVQVIVEGPGHVPLNQIEANILLEKKLCKGAPFYVLGPLVTDIGAGYDHITAAIGGAIAAASGADFLCYVTPSEHLSLPQVEDVRLGVIASRIAAHAADIVKGVKGAEEWDRQMSQARKALDWEAQATLSLDPEHARKVRRQQPSTTSACSMCGPYCAMDLMNKYLNITAERC